MVYVVVETDRTYPNNSRIVNVLRAFENQAAAHELANVKREWAKNTFREYAGFHVTEVPLVREEK